MEHIDVRSKEFEEIAWKASLQAIAESRVLGLPVFGYFEKSKVFFMELPDNTLWEVELFEDGTHKVIRQMEPHIGGFERRYPEVI